MQELIDIITGILNKNGIKLKTMQNEEGLYYYLMFGSVVKGTTIMLLNAHEVEHSENATHTRSNTYQSTTYGQYNTGNESFMDVQYIGSISLVEDRLSIIHNSKKFFYTISDKNSFTDKSIQEIEEFIRNMAITERARYAWGH